jgi:DNA ligase-1
MVDPESKLAPYAGFLVSHKYDGWRGVWDGFRGRMVTKTGKKVFAIPDSWRDGLPKDVILDGEVYLPNHPATKVAHIARHHDSDLWEEARYAVFDVPSAGDRPFSERVRLYEEIVGKSPGKFMFAVEQHVARSPSHILEMYNAILAEGGEGVVITRPDSLYETEKRASAHTRVKLKGRTDAEAVVLGFNMEGSRAKSIRVMELATRAEFNIGIGLTNEMRAEPERFFNKGEIINYSYERMMRTGIPRHARFVRVREEE